MSKTTTRTQIYEEKQSNGSANLPATTDAPITGLQRLQELLNRFWIVELICVVVAVASFIGIVALLAYLDNTALTSWHPRVSPNTVLAILTTTCKSSMIAVISTCIAQLRWPYYTSQSRPIGDLDTFDKATRGPMGAFMFLYSVTRRGGHIAYLTSIAAFLTIIALAVDPFAQQMIKYQVDTVPVTGHASAATMPMSTGVGKGATLLGRTKAWQAMYAGVLAFEYPLPFGCATSNCTYPDFTSLAVCSVCQDATPLLDWQCSSNSSETGNDCSTITSLVQGTNITISLNNGTISSTDGGKEYTLVKGAVSKGFPNGYIDPTIFQVVIAQLLANVTAPVPESAHYNWNTTYCSVQWCARTYKNVTVTNGVLSQPPSIETLFTANTTSNCYNTTTCQEFVPNDSTNVVGHNTSYRVVINQDLASLGELLNFENEIGASASGQWELSNAFSIVSTMFWNVNVTETLGRGTSTFSDEMRISNSPANVTGTALLRTTHIKIRWGWLALPAALVVPSTLLLVTVMLTTYGTAARHRYIWKGSTLPLIFHPANEQVDPASYRHPETMVAMSERAGRVKAQIVENEEGKVAFVVDPHSNTRSS